MEIDTSDTDAGTLPAELYMIGGLYAQQAATLQQFAHTVSALPAELVEVWSPPLTAEQAQSRASFAAMYAQYFHAAATKVATGDYDADFIATLLSFVEEEAIATGIEYTAS